LKLLASHNPPPYPHPTPPPSPPSLARRYVKAAKTLKEDGL
jgi:protein disulfide isomerase